eukprot:gene10135-21134_t
MLNSSVFYSTLLLVLLSTSRAHTHEARTSATRHFEQDLINPVQSKLQEVVFVIKQRNIPLLEAILYNISDPKSSQYGQHLSREEIANLTSSPDSVTALHEFLLDAGVTEINHSHHGEFVTVKAPIVILEQILSTKFHHFTHSIDHEHRITRARSYTLPHPIREHVSYIMNVIDFPSHTPKKLPLPITKQSLQSNDDKISDQKITPSKLISFYNIFTTYASDKASQSIYASQDEYFSSTDIILFQSKFNIPKHTVDNDIDARNDPSTCSSSSNQCIDLNTGCMYIMAIAQNATTTVSNDSNNDGMTSWIISTASSTSSPSLVQSIGYSIYESTLDPNYMKVFNIQAMKLGAMGVTIVASAGSDGAPGRTADVGDCIYDPVFPASSPYVVAVGATMGVESDSTEVACQADLGGVITTGGGFSTLVAAPVFQSKFVEEYFLSLVNATRTTSTTTIRKDYNTTSSTSSPITIKRGYNSTGRAYPDISLAGKNYVAIIGGTEYLVSGSSPATHVFAGMVSLLNTARLQNRKPSIGWMTPAIYSYNGSFANDIDTGNNKCSTILCCEEGFEASTGWDPVTGFGSVDFQSLYNLFR